MSLELWFESDCFFVMLPSQDGFENDCPEIKFQLIAF